MKRRNFMTAGSIAIAGGLTADLTTGMAQGQPRQETEWRHRTSGMAYRRLGRTGYMISEFVMGGNLIAPDNNDHVLLAVEMGLNYFDTAPAYGGTKSEQGYGALIKADPSLRDRVFINSKVSVFDQNRGKFYRALYDELSDSEKKTIDTEVDARIERRGILESEYIGWYFQAQLTEIKAAYLSNVMEEKYGNRIDRRREYYDIIISSVEDSLRRLNTDHLDIVMCPHGASSPEELAIPEIREAMERLKRDGKVRAFGVSAHNDPAGIIRAALDAGFYDMAMVAYNVTNGQFLESTLAEAYRKDFGIVAMKVARPVNPGRPRDIPQSRLDKLNHVIPGDMSIPKKAYLWALQNPNITAVISEMGDADLVRDNLSLAGKKVPRVPMEEII